MNRTKGEMVKELSQAVLKRVDRKEKKINPKKQQSIYNHFNFFFEGGVLHF